VKGEARFVANLNSTLLFPSFCLLSGYLGEPHRTFFLHHKQITLTQHNRNVKILLSWRDSSPLNDYQKEDAAGGSAEPT
jgi:hypothetical protein